MDFALFDCPDCKGSLRPAPDTLACSGCRRQFPVDNGLPNFCRTEVYWGEFDADTSRRLLDQARSQGWRRAVETVLAHRPDLVEYCTDTRRANPLHLIPPNRRETLLDVGTGWGAIASAAASLFKNVYTIEAVPVRARFAHLRFTQEGRDTITRACASILAPPFARPVFDAILLNGILEWIGDWNRTLPPARAQEATLRTLRGLLKPGGFLVAGIENRFGYTYLRGRRDHNGLWGTNLLPRVLADAVSFLRRRERYRVYTHSLPALGRLFRRAGFDTPEVYAPHPAYNRPFSMIALDSTGPLDYYIHSLASEHSWKRRAALRAAAILNAFGPLRLLMPDYFVFARKGEP